MNGKIVKGIAGFYYVHVKDKGIYECKARGIFRNRNVKPLVGDDVKLEILEEAEKKGNITEILPRRNALIRPAAANVDQAMIVFAAASPTPNLGLLDRFLLTMSRQDIPVIICINKQELVDEAFLKDLCEMYGGCGARVLTVSVAMEEGLDKVKELLEGKTTVMAGPSGVGKSSLTNMIYPDADMATGSVSEKIGRGRHTTRHSEIFAIGGDTYLIDTPGFSTIYLDGFEKEELKLYFNEFEAYEFGCRFNGCIHINEPGCAVKKAVLSGAINNARYESYVNIYEELSQIRRY